VRRPQRLDQQNFQQARENNIPRWPLFPRLLADQLREDTKPRRLWCKSSWLPHERSGHDLDDVSARAMEGFFVLCDAINHAGSTDPAKIQAALKATDLKPEQLMVPYDGVKFNEKGQNVLGSTLLEQLTGGDYVVVWPAKYATQKPKLPYQGWAH
jgi:hypothetical protein